MTREEIEIKLIANLPDNSILMNFGPTGQPLTDDASEWLDAAVEAVETMTACGMAPSSAVSHVSIVAELSRSLN